MDITCELVEKGKGVDAVITELERMCKKALYVGIPQENSSSRGGITNAEIAFIMTFGSPVNNVPARPFLEPAINQASTRQRIAQYLQQAVTAAATGKGNPDAMIESAGIIAENAVKKYIDSGNHTPNAPITINGGWMINKVSHKPFKVKGKGSNHPLIDTGSLRSSITHVIRES